jgi:hypothetical protein
MHWVQTNQLGAITECTGYKRIVFLYAIAGYTECKWISFWLTRSPRALSANGSASVDRYWLYRINCDRCNWVLSIDLMLAIIAVGTDNHIFVVACDCRCWCGRSFLLVVTDCGRCRYFYSCSCCNYVACSNSSPSSSLC